MKVKTHTTWWNSIEIYVSSVEEKLQILKKLLNELKIRDIETNEYEVTLYVDNDMIGIEILSEMIIIHAKEKTIPKILEIIGYYDEREIDEKTKWGE